MDTVPLSFPRTAPAGRIATPSPAPTRLSIVARSVASKANCGVNPAARHNWSVTRRKPKPGCSPTNGSFAAASSSTRCRPASACPWRDVQTEPLPFQQVPAEPRGIRSWRDDRDLGLTTLEIQHDVMCRLLAQFETDVWRDSTKGFQQIRHQARGDRVQERQPHGPRLRVEQRVDPARGGIDRARHGAGRLEIASVEDMHQSVAHQTGYRPGDPAYRPLSIALSTAGLATFALLYST